MQLIPLSQIPAQTFNVKLAGQHCTISVYWRQERLYLDLLVDKTVICQGAICQNRADVVQSKTPFFSGSLHFFDTEGDRPPHWQGLYTGSTGRWMFVFVEEESRGGGRRRRKTARTTEVLICKAAFHSKQFS